MALNIKLFKSIQENKEFQYSYLKKIYFKPVTISRKIITNNNFNYDTANKNISFRIKIESKSHFMIQI